MYNITYLPVAQRDLVEIASYIANTLSSKKAALDTISGITGAVSSLASMPYRRRVYRTLKPLAHDYRSIGYGNYLAFYWVDEGESSVVVARVLYSKSSIAQRLK